MAWSNSFRAPTKFVPLSLLISLTGPRRAMKRRSARMNEFDSRELATSIERIVNREPYRREPHRFTSLRPSLMMKGPK